MVRTRFVVAKFREVLDPVSSSRYARLFCLPLGIAQGQQGLKKAGQDANDERICDAVESIFLPMARLK
jgi:hypothetical protein